ncbi:hypothetical protein JCM16303_003328 [Sporobolomyces ruberrimus]
MSTSAHFVPPQGFHPVLHLSIPPTRAPDESCSLFTLISVPSSFIIDRYQLSQLHLEGKLGTLGGLAEVVGEGDLEGPVWKTKGAAVLVQLSDHNEQGRTVVETELEVPLHMRYQVPATKRRRTSSHEREDQVRVEMDQPKVFWACDHVSGRSKPVPRECPPSSLSSEYSFPSLSNSTIHHVASSSPRSCNMPYSATLPPLAITLPTGIESHARFVGPVTVSVIWLGFFFLTWTTYGVWRRGTRTTKNDGWRMRPIERKTQ